MSIFGPRHRTRSEVIGILESALVTNGDSAFDDFIHVAISDPELEAIRLVCLDVSLAPTPLFNETLTAALAQLRAAKSDARR